MLSSLLSTVWRAKISGEVALREFDQVAKCAGFMDVSDEVLESLLDDDALVSEREQRVLEGLVGEVEA